MPEKLIPPEMLLMQILDAVEKGVTTVSVVDVPQEELGRLIRHAINFGYIREGTTIWPDLPHGVKITVVVPPIEPRSLTPRGKRYLDHLREEFES